MDDEKICRAADRVFKILTKAGLTRQEMFGVLGLLLGELATEGDNTHGAALKIAEVFQGTADAIAAGKTKQ